MLLFLFENTDLCRILLKPMRRRVRDVAFSSISHEQNEETESAVFLLGRFYPRSRLYCLLMTLQNDNDSLVSGKLMSVWVFSSSFRLIRLQSWWYQNESYIYSRPFIIADFLDQYSRLNRDLYIQSLVRNYLCCLRKTSIQVSFKRFIGLDLITPQSTTYNVKMSRIMTKPTKWHLRPAKTQISLGIRPVWSDYSLCAQWVVKDPRFFHADSEDSDQTGRMPRLIWVFAGRTCHFVGFVMRWLKWLCNNNSDNFISKG